MEDTQKSRAELIAEIESLRERLAMSEETLQAIQNGEVDALVIFTQQGERIFTLQTADQSYRLIVEKMQQGSAIISTEGLILYCNKSFANLLKQPIEKLREVRPWYLLNQEIGGIIFFAEDITNRRQTEASLEESQLQLQHQLAEIEAIYQSAPIGLNILDTNLRFVRINQRLAEINGLSIEAHLGRTVREVLPEISDTAEKLLHSILETGEPILNVEISGETPAQPGIQRTWLESFLPLKDGDRIIGISTVCEEITNRKKAEEELRRAKEELEIR